jgi:hypothetical protein
MTESSFPLRHGGVKHQPAAKHEVDQEKIKRAATRPRAVEGPRPARF